MEPLAKAKVPVGLFPALADRGIDARAVLRTAQLGESVVAPGTWLPVERYFALWRGIEAVARSANIGLELARAVRADHTEPLFLALFGAENLGAALRAIARYKRMLSPEEVVVTIRTDTIELSIRWPARFGEAPRALVDVELAFIVELFRRATRRPDATPTRVGLMTRSLPPGAMHAGFFRSSIALGEPTNSLTFNLADAAIPFASHNPELRSALDPWLESQLPSEVVVPLDRVRAAIEQRLRGERPSVEGVARSLGMSTRSFQRLLKDHRTSFRAVLDDVRNRKARDWLRAAAFREAEIAYLLGFEDASSFHRAFRVWNGITPRQFRERALA